MAMLKACALKTQDHMTANLFFNSRSNILIQEAFIISSRCFPDHAHSRSWQKGFKNHLKAKREINPLLVYRNPLLSKKPGNAQGTHPSIREQG